jgi:hypothetical protein
LQDADLPATDEALLDWAVATGRVAAVSRGHWAHYLTRFGPKARERLLDLTPIRHQAVDPDARPPAVTIPARER